MSRFFTREHPIALGSDSADLLAYRWYDPGQVVMGKTMAEQLRFAVCYWHTLCGEGGDPFGGRTFQRPWFDADPMVAAQQKADVMFELLALLDAPYFTFHDVDAAPEDDDLGRFRANLDQVAALLADKMQASGRKLLWGTANLFSHRRYMAGAATNPDPAVFAHACGQVKNALEITHQLGGENYVLWGGREGYETLLNTNLGQEMQQMARFLHLVAEHAAKIGFSGQLLIEPKPQEPTKHQYDFDVATVWGFLKTHGLDGVYRINIEQNHAILAGHSFEHEIALALALGAFGSIDINRGDYQSGWDTDQFAMNVPDLSLAFVELLRAGGFTSGGLNFDAKLRRQSLDPDDLLYAHVGSIDACARALLCAEKILTDGRLEAARAARYAGWRTPQGQAMLAGSESLETIAVRATNTPAPHPVSGRQEYLETLINSLQI